MDKRLDYDEPTGDEMYVIRIEAASGHRRKIITTAAEVESWTGDLSLLLGMKAEGLIMMFLLPLREELAQADQRAEQS